jgi:hypothetical protein
MRLTDVAGFGDGLAGRLVAAFGSEEEAISAARRQEVERIAAVEGVGERKAVDLVLAASGRETNRFLRTPRAEALYEDILDRIRAYASTPQGKARVSLLVPMTKREEIEAHMAAVERMRTECAGLSREPVRAALARITRPKTPKPRFDSGTLILVESEAESEKLIHAGVDRFCRIATPEDDFASAELVVYAYSSGGLDVSAAEHVISRPFTTNVAELVPDVQLSYFLENRGLWEGLENLARSRGVASRATQILAILDRLVARKADFAELESAVRAVVVRMNEEIRQRIGSESLTGEEVLALMAGRPPRRISSIQATVLREGRERLLRETGEDFLCFTDGFPIAIDEDALGKIAESYAGRQRRAQFRERVDALRELAPLRARIEEEIDEVLAFDFRFALASFVEDYRLSAPTFEDRYAVEGALHLALAAPGAGGVPVVYSLGGPDSSIALLTGANSGGKTTLLETLAQIAILAHMGLPVPARQASVPRVEAVYFFTQRRNLDAGAFESFLRGFVPIVGDPAPKLVLADELEAMTELEAASRILGTFLRMLSSTESFGVCVTHMADEILRFADVRVDGIEAKGLDEDLNLIVDRTPRMGVRARSTPEFILRRLAARAGERERPVFEAILASFGSRAEAEPPASARTPPRPEPARRALPAAHRAP